MLRGTLGSSISYIDKIGKDGEDVCVGCGMERSEWKGNNGGGYTKNGVNYCCIDCAEDIECECGL
jgi:hypothetical protein